MQLGWGFEPTSDQLRNCKCPTRLGELLKLLLCFLRDNTDSRSPSISSACARAGSDVYGLKNITGPGGSAYAALHFLKSRGDVVYPVIRDILTDPTRNLLQKSILKAAEEILEQVVPPEELDKAWEEIERRRQKREELRARFEMDAESWRVELD